MAFAPFATAASTIGRLPAGARSSTMCPPLLDPKVCITVKAIPLLALHFNDPAYDSAREIVNRDPIASGRMPA